MNKNKNIAIIAFESRKTDLIEWSYFNKELLLSHQITAIGFAANILEGTLNKKINQIEPGNFGGFRQLQNLIIENKIDAIIIFGEAKEVFENNYLNAVLEIAALHNILIAANRTTADFIMHSSLIKSEYKIHSTEKKPSDKEVLSNTSSYPFAKAS
ncbi:MAG TPA: methylglyoxal synthase [Parafilimonas sp.]|jgi:methylglyoxal synthase